MAEVITNDPILLNETGLLMLTELKRHNTLMSLIAEGSRSDVYSNITDVAHLVRGGTLEDNKRIFPIGDRLIIPWKDMDDSAHNTDATAYQVPMDIVHHGEVELTTGEIVPGMFLQWHYTTPYGMPFGRQQSFMKCTAGLAAGTYYIVFGSNWGANAVSGASWNFTITQAIPAGGYLSGFEGMPDLVSSNWRVMSWASATSTSPIETVTVSSGVAGTNLGTMLLSSVNGNLNSMQKVAYGGNRWKTSGLRRYMNKSGQNWFTQQETYDLRPNEYAKYGFLSGFGDDFLQATRLVKVSTAVNTLENSSGIVDDTFDRFFLPSVEQMNATPWLAGVEGNYFEYWRRRLELNAPALNYPSVYEGFKIPAVNAQMTPQVYRLRSAASNYVCYSFVGLTSGGINGTTGSSIAYRLTPVCVVC